VIKASYLNADSTKRCSVVRSVVLVGIVVAFGAVAQIVLA